MTTFQLSIPAPFSTVLVLNCYEHYSHCTPSRSRSPASSSQVTSSVDSQEIALALASLLVPVAYSWAGCSLLLFPIFPRVYTEPVSLPCLCSLYIAVKQPNFLPMVVGTKFGIGADWLDGRSLEFWVIVILEGGGGRRGRAPRPALCTGTTVGMMHMYDGRSLVYLCKMITSKWAAAATQSVGCKRRKGRVLNHLAHRKDIHILK